MLSPITKSDLASPFGEKPAPADKLPPQSIEAEESVLGALLMDKNAIIRVADILRPEDFYKRAHQLIFESIIHLYEKSEPVDVLSLSNRLKETGQMESVGGASYLTGLVGSVVTAANVLHYGKIVRHKKILRDLLAASHDIARLGFEENKDIETVLDEAEKRVFAIAERSLKQDFLPIKSALEDAFHRIDKLHKGDGALRGLATGFVDLDNLLAGLQKSDLVILAARPSLGKTSLALDIARHAAIKEKASVGVFSLEMSKEQLVDRLLASEAGVDLWRLRTGRLSLDGENSDFVKIQEAMGILAEAPIFIDDAASANIMQMRTMARRLQAEHGLGLIIVDYLQLMEGRDSGSDNRVQEISEISRSLKNLARELAVPVLALSQLSRAVEGRSPQIPKLSDLRESGCLAGDTLVMRADTGELIPIKKLAGQKNIPVFSLNDQNLKLEIKKISKVFSSGYKQLFELQTKSGRTIKASANHPFRTLSGWIRVDQLARGQRLALPRRLNPLNSPANISNDELILLAHLTGDGCVLPRQPIHYTSADIKNINKRLPEGIFGLPASKIQLFLHHLWATDGNISWKKLRGRKPAAAIYFASSSKILAQQVQHLLLRLGIFSALKEVEQSQGKYRVNYHVRVQGAEMQIRFCRLVGSFGARGEIVPHLLEALTKIKTNPNNDVIPREAWNQYINPVRISAGLSWRDFSEKINTSYCGNTLFKSGLSRTRMMRVAQALPFAPLVALAESDIYWDEVASITPLGTEEVFDATVPETHNFLANDFIVHNSIEQDADVVLFIYREDREKPNTEKKNIAEIHIAKHRNGPVGKVELYFNADQVSFKSLAKHIEHEA